MAIQFKNNAATTLASPIGEGALSLSVATGTGSLFPTLGVGDYFYCTLIDNSAQKEIVKVTARATDTFTIVRAQEGTSALSFVAGNGVELRLTTQGIEDKFDELVTEAETTLQNAELITLTSVSGSNTISGIAGSPFIGLADGQEFSFIAAADSTGTVTLNISSTGAKIVTKNGGDLLISGDILSGSFVKVKYILSSDSYEILGVGTRSLTFLRDTAQSKFIPATDFITRTTAGAPLNTTEITTNKTMTKTLDFDASTIEYAQCYLDLPQDWNLGTMTLQFVWSHAATTTNFSVAWAAQAKAITNGDSIDASWGTAVVPDSTNGHTSGIDVGGNTDTLYTTEVTTNMTVSGSPGVGDTVILQLYRNASAGGDTLAVDARLHGIFLYYNTMPSVNSIIGEIAALTPATSPAWFNDGGNQALFTYILNTSAGTTQLVASQQAMEAIAASSDAMNAICNTAANRAIVADSLTAMTAILETQQGADIFLSQSTSVGVGIGTYLATAAYDALANLEAVLSNITAGPVVAANPVLGARLAGSTTMATLICSLTNSAKQYIDSSMSKANWDILTAQSTFNYSIYTATGISTLKETATTSPATFVTVFQVGSNRLIGLVGTNDTNIYVSDNYGETWSIKTAPSTSTWYCGAYDSANSRIVIASRAGASAYSTDNGNTWVAGGNTTSSNWRVMAYGNGQFVMVSESSTTLTKYSTNGVSWSNGSLPVTATWTGLAFGNSVFVATGSSGETANSADGITWVAGPTIASQSSTTITYVGDRFLTRESAAGAAFTLYTSNDGTAFTLVYTATGTPTTDLSYITYCSTKDVCIMHTTGSEFSLSFNKGSSWTPYSEITALTTSTAGARVHGSINKVLIIPPAQVYQL